MNPKCPTRPLAVILGGGPGEPDLVPLAAAKWLSAADTVLYDRLAPPALLELAPEAAERIAVGKAPGSRKRTQEQINELLISKCRRGRLVVRLKGGDPLTFARGAEEAEALAAASIPFRIVPGITAAAAAAAYAGIPLTDRRFASTVAFVAGHQAEDKDEDGIDWPALARIDTLVVYMGVGNLERITERLIAAGRDGDSPAVVIADASTSRQRTVAAALRTIATRARAEDIKPPAVMICGRVAGCYPRLAWFEKLPLFGRTVLVTRPTAHAGALRDGLAALGANVLLAPAIAIEPPTETTALDDALRDAGRFDWLVLTSSNGP